MNIRTALTGAACAALLLAACGGGSHEERPAARPVSSSTAEDVRTWYAAHSHAMDVGSATLNQISERADAGDVDGAKEACGIGIGAWSDVSAALDQLPESVRAAKIRAYAGASLIRTGLRECVDGNFGDAAADIRSGGEEFSAAADLLTP